MINELWFWTIIIVLIAMIGGYIEIRRNTIARILKKAALEEK